MAFPSGGYTLDPNTNPESSAVQHIKEGEYLFTFKAVRTVSEDKAKHPLILVFEIADGPEAKGRSFVEFAHVFTENGGKRFYQAYQAVGGKPAQFHEKFGKVTDYAAYKRLAEALSKMLAGKQVGASIYDDTYEGKVRSKVNEFYPASEYAERSKYNAPAESPNGVEAPPELVADIDELAASL